jgi:hypothetical protein
VTTQDQNGTLDPLTWTMDAAQVEFIWKESREVFGNKLWFESMLYGPGLPEPWQRELARRSGENIMEVVLEAVGDLREPDPSLVFLGLHDTFARYRVTLEIPPHPIHGDLLARARGLVAAGASRPTYAPAVWHLDGEDVAALWQASYTPGSQHRRFADIFEGCLGDVRADELSLRYGGEIPVAVYSALHDLAQDADPSLTLLALREYFADRYHGAVTLEYAPHPMHGHVLERARRALAGRLDDPAD